jgi:phenylacetate-CoA ligase
VPDYLKILLDKAAEAGRDASSIRKAVVSGGALFPSLRAEYQARGVDTFQLYATADVGIIAYESGPREGMIVDEGVIVEIVRPGTGDPVPEGDVGEVVVTSFNRDYPMIRLATGDMSAVLPGVSPCGRTNLRIKGWLGRADQTAKVRGMFVHPSQVAEIARRHPEVKRARLVISGEMANDRMELRLEVDGAPEGLAERAAASARDVTKLRAEVALVATGSLPNDGKVIDDQRKL